MNQQVYFNNVSFYVVNSTGQKEAGVINASYLMMFNIDAFPIMIPEHIASEKEISTFIVALPNIQKMNLTNYNKSEIMSFVIICMFLKIKNNTSLKDAVQNIFNVNQTLELDIMIAEKLCTNNIFFSHELITHDSIAYINMDRLKLFMDFLERKNQPTCIMESIIGSVKNYMICNKIADDVIKIADSVLSFLIEHDSIHKVSFYEYCPIDVKKKYYNAINTLPMEYVEKTRNEGRKSNVHEVCSIEGVTFRIVICKTDKEHQFGTFKHDTHYSTNETKKEVPNFAKIESINGNWKTLSGVLYENKVYIYVPQHYDPNRTWFDSRYTLIINHDSLKNM